ncbi:MAG: hypothetical protein MZV64_64535 [Ignavibacteriales bacterium]|nr:hypothetical protein [Ignavibacteriales bacterium]
MAAATACRTDMPKPGPVRVLILSGQGNHDWRSTTPKLVAILQDERPIRGRRARRRRASSRPRDLALP